MYMIMNSILIQFVECCFDTATVMGLKSNENLRLCGSRKYPYSCHGFIQNSKGEGRGGLKSQSVQKKYEVKLGKKGWGPNQNIFSGRVMDIFWDTLCKFQDQP